MHRVAAAYLIALIATLAACEEQKAAPEEPRALPPNLLKPPEASTAAQKQAQPQEKKDCDVPHTGLETVKVYVGLDQLAFPLFVPESFDPEHPPPLVIFAPDRYFETSAWLKTADLWKAAGEAGFIVGVVHRFKSPAGARDVQSVISSIEKQNVCFDPDRVFAIGAGSGARAVADAACDGAFKAIMTSGDRPTPSCARSELRHLHFVHKKDKTAPIRGAKPRALSTHEQRIKDQLSTMAIANMPLKRDMLPPQAGDGDTPCPPPGGIVSVDEFVTEWCGPLGCADAEPSDENGCEVRQGRGNLTVCTVNDGRIWTPDYAPFNGCYGTANDEYDYLGRTFEFFRASKP